MINFLSSITRSQFIVRPRPFIARCSRLCVPMLCITLVACAMESPRAYFGEVDAMMEAPRETAAAPMPAAKMARRGEMRPQEPAISGAAKPDSRKLHYDGDIKLLVTNRRNVIKKIIALVKRYKGYLERIDEDTVVLQIPVASFETSFDEIMKFGKVLSKLVTTSDITAEYTSVELRLRISRSTRERLLALLRKAKDEEQKLKLLQQLEQINVRIQRLESMFAALKTKVDYSKVTVHLQAYNRFTQGDQGFEPQGMAWIASLSPFNDGVAYIGEKLAFQVPDGMLRVNKDRAYWAVESGDRVLFRAYRRANHPTGNDRFWLDAIKLRMLPKYKTVQEVNSGGFKLLRMESFEDQPSIYYVGLKLQGDDIGLVELYFPDAKLEQKYKSAIFASIERGVL